ncbi:MAG: sodium:solute symporter family protein [Christensenellaceae bacterium]|jgi:SSS family transporter|nr:sodium:solute symporter family protein [Christensenellaceae bacterium]
MASLIAATDSWSAFLILTLYLASMVVISIVSRRRSASLGSFYLSNRGLGGWMSAFAYGTTYFSAVVFIGYAGRFGLSMGLSSFWIGVSNALIGALLAWVILAKRTRRMTINLNTSTMPEFFEKRYNHPKIKLYSSVVIFILLIPYSTSVYQGLGYIIESVFNIPFEWCVIIMAVITALYLFTGGYFAEALSDFIQGIIMILGVGLLLIFMFSSSQVSGNTGIQKLTDLGYGFFPSYNSASGKIIDSPGFNLIIMILLTSFGIWSLPQAIHKFHTIKSNSAIKKGTIVSAVFALIIGGGAYLNGGFARLFFPNGAPENNTDLVITGMFDLANFNPALLGLIGVLVLSASMSTLAALSLSSASTVSIDIYKGYIKKDASDQKVKSLMRLLCLFFIFLSAILAIKRIDAIVTLMSLSWGTIAGCFIGPYIYGLYSKKTTATAALVSISSGLIVTLTLVLVFGFTESPSNSTFGVVLKTGVSRAPLIGVIAMALSMIITPIVSLFTKKPSDSLLRKAFNLKEPIPDDDPYFIEDAVDLD